MWIFSEEMYNAQNYGYKFQILEGYTFERQIVFKDYVELLPILEFICLNL
jgi:hypothetical protein